MITTKKMKNASSNVDRISELPDGIIHQILLDLDSYRLAARTSILSRRWLHLWRSYPVFEYDYNQTPKFQEFAAAASKRLLRQRSESLFLESFTLRLCNWENCGSLDNLLSSASLNCGRRSPLKVVLVNLSCEYRRFNGEKFMNLSRTKFLHLQGFDLTSRFKTRLDNLQELHLQQVSLSQLTFPSCLANAPRLEKLSLVCIKGIHSLDISASNFPSLKSLSFDGQNRNGPQQLQLSSAILLQTLYFRGNCKFLEAVWPLSTPNLKFVELHPEVEFRSRELQNLISKLPSLESLDFNLPDDDELTISAPMLRKLTVRKWYWQTKLEIDAPNLVNLSIEIDGLPLNLRVVNVASTCQCVVDCSPSDYLLEASWLIHLRNCLTSLAHRFNPLVFKLDFKLLESVLFDFSQVGCESSPMIIQHLQLGTNLPLGPDEIEQHARETHLLDGLLSIFRPKTLSIARLPHSLCDTSLFSTKKLRKCCSNGRCWRHQFKDAEMRSVTVDDLSTIDKSMNSQSSINMIFILPEA
ncbi:Putative F-box protein At2g39415 [Linum perenne]